MITTPEIEKMATDDGNRGSPSEHHLLELLRHGHRIEALDRIKSHKDEVNMVDDGSTPLLVATTRGWGDVVEVLIENGANVNAISDLGETPLMRALKSGKINPHVIKLLLDHGAVETLNVAAKENAFFSKWTALHFACDADMNHTPSVVALLVSYGASTKAAAGNGKTPADMCSRNAEFTKALLRGKEYLKSHPLPPKASGSSDHDAHHEHEPMQLGSEQAMSADDPQRHSRLHLGIHLFSKGRKHSTMIQEMNISHGTPLHSNMDTVD
jgi:hypothetical protein